MLKRVIKIILILLAILFVTLGVIWLVGRHAAQKNGKTPLTFRQFLGLSTKTAPTSTVPSGTDTATFTGPGANGSGTNSNGTGAGFSENAQVSQFTNNGISINNGTGTNFQTVGSGGAGNGATIPDSAVTAASSASSAPICSDADVNISFTPDELAQLNQLQNRFYAIAQNLHTDADVATELANHDAFAVKADQTTELYNYCESKLPSITDPRLQQHVATPFWNDSTHDSLSFIDFSQLDAAHLAQVHDTNVGDGNSRGDTSGIKGPYGLLNFSAPTAVAVTGSVVKPNGDFQLLIPVVEKILRINLW